MEFRKLHGLKKMAVYWVCCLKMVVYCLWRWVIPLRRFSSHYWCIFLGQMQALIRLGLVSVVVLLIVHPIKVQSARAWLNRTMSVAYPKQVEPRITVILATDHTLTGDLSWPLPYQFHARLMRSLLANPPRVFFVDLLLPD